MRLIYKSGYSTQVTTKEFPKVAEESSKKSSLTSSKPTSKDETTEQTKTIESTPETLNEYNASYFQELDTITEGFKHVFSDTSQSQSNFDNTTNAETKQKYNEGYFTHAKKLPSLTNVLYKTNPEKLKHINDRTSISKSELCFDDAINAKTKQKYLDHDGQSLPCTRAKKIPSFTNFLYKSDPSIGIKKPFPPETFLMQNSRTLTDNFSDWNTSKNKRRNDENSSESIFEKSINFGNSWKTCSNISTKNDENLSENKSIALRKSWRTSKNYSGDYKDMGTHVGLGNSDKRCVLSIPHQKQQLEHQCRYFYIGCEIKGSSVELEIHYKRCTEIHLDLACKSYMSKSRMVDKCAIKYQELEDLQYKYGVLSAENTKNLNDAETFKFQLSFKDKRIKYLEALEEIYKENICALERKLVNKSDEFERYKKDASITTNKIYNIDQSRKKRSGDYDKLLIHYGKVMLVCNGPSSRPKTRNAKKRLSNLLQIPAKELISDRISLQILGVKKIICETAKSICGEYSVVSERFYVGAPGPLCQFRAILCGANLTFDFCVRMGIYDENIEWPLCKTILLQINTNCTNASKRKILTKLKTSDMAYIHACKPILETGNLVYKHKEFFDISEYLQQYDNLLLEFIIC